MIDDLNDAITMVSEALARINTAKKLVVFNRPALPPEAATAIYELGDIRLKLIDAEQRLRGMLLVERLVVTRSGEQR